ncbi:uncharacterized protein N0V96_011125 [Colletotrichum fioriniae]|uniref:uncharacterized protein n=1 Tax=Colletotrichum fioriniae TaxID=710243 RepID=UPI0032DB9C73|nr:hypothetical protein N0V96_011125 [Colletotrichum fioriniae]
MAVADGCHGDNLLRAMERHNGTMYCSMLLESGDATATLSLPDPIPTSYPALSVTSACSCLLALEETPRAPCHANATATPAADYSTEIDDPGSTDAASATVVSNTQSIPTAHATFDGGYSYSFPGPAIPSETAPTCGWGEVTATVQVTETQVSTIYIYSSGIPNTSSAQSLSSVSDGDSGGRPAPLHTTKIITGEASGSAPGIVSTVTLIGDSTVVLPTQTGKAIESTAAVPRVTTIISGNYTTVNTISGGESESSSTKSMWHTTDSNGIWGCHGSPTATATPTVFTSVIDGVASTWTVVGGSTIFGTLTPGSSNLITPTAISLTGGATFVSTLNGTVPTAGSSSSTTGFPSAPASTSATSTSSYDSAFTGISVVVAQNATSCYALPTPTASLHESLLNVTDRTPPYINAFYLNETTHSVQYLRLIDNATNPVLVDVSDPSSLGIVDKAGNVLSIDSEGLHFASANCSPKIDVFISGFFQQLNTLTNSTCNNTTDIPVNGTDPRRLPVFKGTLAEMAQDAFDITLHLKDQCGNPARADLPVSVALGDTQCIVLPGAAGEFVANCAFPGSGSDSMECETSVQQTLDHLTQGSLVGSCPPLTSVWSLLFQQLGSVVNVDELLQPFVDAGLQLLAVIDSFMDLYDFSAATFKNSTSGSGSGLGDIVEGYGVTTIKTEVCRSLISTETLNLTFTAGTSATPISLANITALPSTVSEYERNVTDPTALACCPNANACIVHDGERFYPPEASIPDSDCLCGKTLEGGGEDRTQSS